uniref:Probable protein-export membrane protein SecG n=1 Tax=Sporolithon durum TaxID=48970 RepID=A0A141SCR2_9FLOR|nr:preprotein translocase subunit G [Sporolithon durum]AMK96080.1 preprotein translocase subunit G [Sporolithon durum]
MKSIWYLSSLIIIMLILIDNPKAKGLDGLGSQSQLFSYTRSTRKKLQTIIIFSILIFLLFTILFASNLNYVYF